MILVLNDELSIQDTVSTLLKDGNCPTLATKSPEETLVSLKAKDIAAAVVDIKASKVSDVRFLEKIKKVSPDTQVLVITSHSSLETALPEWRSGNLEDPLMPVKELETLAAAVRHVARKARRSRNNRDLVINLQKKNKELVSMNDLLKNLASQDGLTGLFNHRHFHEILAVEISRSIRHDHPFTLIFLDVDHFKNYNDRHGHLRGDLVLREIANILKTRLRKSDILARYGGEEFIVLLPETPKEAGKSVAEQIRKKIEAFPFFGRETQPLQKVTVSLGVAGFPGDGRDATALLDFADKVLYKAKESGKNMVCLSP